MKISRIVIPFFARIDDTEKEIKKKFGTKAKILDMDVANEEIWITRDGTSQPDFEEDKDAN